MLAAQTFILALWYGFVEFGTRPPEAGEPGWLRDPAHNTRTTTAGVVEKTASQKSSAVMREAWHKMDSAL